MNQLGTLQVFDDPQRLAEGLADFFVAQAHDAIAQRGRFCVCLAGGTTPKAAYQLLGVPPRRDRIAWAHVAAYFGDERCVPPSDPQSNFKTAHDALLGAVPIPASHVYRMHGEDEPAAAARAYAQILRETLGDPPVFDLLMLGMGNDTHTASLFPGTDPYADDDLLVRGVYAEHLGMYRLTVTPRVINAARAVVVATEGTGKAQALADAFNGERNPIKHPVQIVQPQTGELYWLVDRAAASLL